MVKVYWGQELRWVCVATRKQVLVLHVSMLFQHTPKKGTTQELSIHFW